MLSISYAAASLTTYADKRCQTLPQKTQSSTSLGAASYGVTQPLTAAAGSMSSVSGLHGAVYRLIKLSWTVAHRQEVSLTNGEKLIYSEVEVRNGHRRGQLAMLLC